MLKKLIFSTYYGWAYTIYQIKQAVNHIYIFLLGKIFSNYIDGEKITYITFSKEPLVRVLIAIKENVLEHKFNMSRHKLTH